MAEQTKKTRLRRLRHRGRGSQVLIYFGKQLRFFINQNDWKVLPMAAIIAALVAMVMRIDFFKNMEGNLMGAFALTCVGIWNGSFNSIQAVCRERPIIKREHRSGMHVSSYVAAHMLYQLMLCVLQTGLTIYVLLIMGVQFPMEGIITPYMVVDVAITLLLITYASDMMSLFLSSVAHTTTSAMTLMPFVLIFQLVFSGGLLPLPEWTKPLSGYTISNYGLQCLAAQAGYNESPMKTGWKTLESMRNDEIGGTFTLGQVMDLVNSPAIQKRRDMTLMEPLSVGEAAQILSEAESSLHLRDREVITPITVGELMKRLMDVNALQNVWGFELPWKIDGKAVNLRNVAEEFLKEAENQGLADTSIDVTVTLGQILDVLHADAAVELMADAQISPGITLGDVADFMNTNEALQAQRDREFTVKTTIGELLDVFGKENVKRIVETKTGEAAYKPEYSRDPDNIVDNWIMLGVFVVVFAMMATIALELIDRDKR